jgi:uroporphyrinogen-III decarboxylase
MYKFALEGILEDYSLEKEVWKIHGEELAGIEISAQERFDPDFIQVAEAFFESKKELINDVKYNGLLEEARCLKSKSAIDEFLDLVYLGPKELGKKKKFDHVKILSEKYGKEKFILLTTEGPVHDLMDEDGILGFELGMISLIQAPEMFVYIMERMYERQLKYVRAVKDYGAHGYSQSFSYLSADMVSPELYKKLLFPIQRDFYREVERIGLYPIICTWGSITPNVRYIKETGIRGLMIEESRKSFTNDVGEIKKEAGTKIGVFGNVSGEQTLLHGSVSDVRDEVMGQTLKAGREGGFISSSGTPIAFGTPVENVKALIDTAKGMKFE